MYENSINFARKRQGLLFYGREYYFIENNNQTE
jgi:hypothetical protein